MSNGGDENNERSKRQRQKKFIELFVDTGNIAKVCSTLQISPSTYYRWLERDKRFKADLDEVLSKRTDIAKSALFALLMDKDHKDHFNALKMVLSRDKEWSEQENVNLNASIKMQIEFVEPADDGTA
jgi:transposase